MGLPSLVPQPRTDAVALQAINDFQSDMAEIIGAPYSRSVQATTYILSGMIVLAFLLMATVRLDTIVSSRGKLISRVPTIQIQPLETAVVRQILVHTGQEVKKGDLLVTLDPTFSAADEAQLREKATTLSATVDRLLAEQEQRAYDPGPDPTPAQQLQLSVFRYREAELTSRMANFDQKLQTAMTKKVSSQRDAAHYRERLGVTTEIEQMRSNLERKEIGSKLNTLLATDAKTEMSRNLSKAEQEGKAAASELEAMKAEREAYMQKWRTDLTQELVKQQSELATVQENLSKATRRKDLVELRAIDDGSVLSVADVAPGAVVQSGNVLVALVPANAPLEVESEIDGADQGFVKVGDHVEIKLDAYRFIEHGTAKGVVRSISDNSFAENDAQKTTGRRFYRARIELTDTRLRRVRDLHLVPGMPLSADIVVGSRTIFMYFMESALRMSAEGLREPY